MNNGDSSYWSELGKTVLTVGALTAVGYGVAIGATYLAHKAGLVDDKAKVVLASGSIAK